MPTLKNLVLGCALGACFGMLMNFAKHGGTPPLRVWIGFFGILAICHIMYRKEDP